MRVLDRVELVRKELEAARTEGRAVGLVPTMGSLHEGHASLIRRSAAECATTLVTVFVNPLQFGAGEDFTRYPRDVPGDAALAAAAGADLVFAPPVVEMYPAACPNAIDVQPATVVTVAGLTDMLEGATRPGHFTGVATVVAKLFAIAGPCRAYFGEKDYQQLLVVRRLAADLSYPVDVVACPTVREPDGLAVSSRNAYLSQPERAAAPVLHRAMAAAVNAVAGLRGPNAIAAGETDADRLRTLMVDTVAAEPLARLDYAEVADAATLAPLARVAGEARLLVAAWVGATRLIDNRGVSR